MYKLLTFVSLMLLFVGALTAMTVVIEEHRPDILSLVIIYFFSAVLATRLSNIIDKAD